MLDTTIKSVPPKIKSGRVGRIGLVFSAVSLAAVGSLLLFRPG